LRNAFFNRDLADRVFALHLALIAALLSGHVMAHALYPVVDHQVFIDILKKLDLVEENSVPNFLSAAALLAGAGVAALIAQTSRLRDLKTTAGWFIAAAALLLLGVDEGAGLHDLLADPLQGILQTRGLLFIGWVIPYAVLTCVVAYMLLPLAGTLSPATRNRLVLAAGVYVAGAMGLEMVEAVLMDNSTTGGFASVDLAAVNSEPAMVILVTIEEVLEMFAVALAFRALLIHLTQELGVRLFDEQVFERRRAPRQNAIQDPSGNRAEA